MTLCTLPNPTLPLFPRPQGQVEVLVLPYYRAGRLVDIRCLHISGGQLLGSWLAVGAQQMYMREELVQVRTACSTAHTFILNTLECAVGHAVLPSPCS